MLKKIAIFFVLAVMAASISACSKVPPGNVGIRVNMLGSDKGVELEQLTPGWYWVGPTQELYLFPTFTVNYVWTKDSTLGSEGDESISFQTSEGLSVNADVGITYFIESEKAAVLFQKYRRGIDEITDAYLRNMVRDALITVASRNKIEYVYGAGREALMNEVESIVSSEVVAYGIKIEKIYWIGDLRLPEQVVEALNAKISAIQRAEQRNNEIAEKRAEAQKKIEEARGIAESEILQAEARAKAIEIEGEAISKHPHIVTMRQIERWDGKLPQFMGSSTPIPMLNFNK